MNTHAPDVVIYTTRMCSFCTAAKYLLDSRGIPWREIPVDADPGQRLEMQARSGRRTVPQIFIDGRPVGGYDALRALELAGELDALLAGRLASA